MNRLLVLTRVIDELGPIKGEKCLQKIMYLIQSNGEPLGYSFSWNSYGPIAHKIQTDIKELNALGLISIILDNDVPVYHISDHDKLVTSYWAEKYKNYNLPSRTAKQIELMKSKLGSKIEDPLSLEIIASLDYLKKKKQKDPVNYLINLSKGRITKQAIEHATHDIPSSFTYDQ